MLVHVLALSLFIKKMTRKNTVIDVELGQEAQPAAVGLAGAAAIPGAQDEIDEGVVDPISPISSSPPEVSLLN